MAGVWFISDAPEWQREDDYNPRAAVALACVFERLRLEGRLSITALSCLAPVADDVMCKSQRLRALYVLAFCRAAEDPPTPAIPVIDEALELTLELNEPRAQLDLLLLRGAVHRCVTQIPDAADDLRDCLQALVSLNLHEDWGDDELLTTLRVTVRLAAHEFLIGAYDEAQNWLDHAATLLPRVGADHDALGRYAWNRALLFRWSGDYQAAFTAAQTATEEFRLLHDPQNLSRIVAIEGDIMLDLAERSRRQDDDASCKLYLAQAEPFIEQAIEIAVRNDFQASEVLARIIRARLQLLQGLPGDRKPLLEEIARMAWEHQDMHTVCKAYTGIGRECEATHNDTAAKSWYRRAVAVLKESEAVADAVWAQRALWRLEGEMSGMPIR